MARVRNRSLGVKRNYDEGKQSKSIAARMHFSYLRRNGPSQKHGERVLLGIRVSQSRVFRYAWRCARNM